MKLQKSQDQDRMADLSCRLLVQGFHCSLFISLSPKKEKQPFSLPQCSLGSCEFSSTVESPLKAQHMSQLKVDYRPGPQQGGPNANCLVVCVHFPQGQLVVYMKTSCQGQRWSGMSTLEQSDILVEVPDWEGEKAGKQQSSLHALKYANAFGSPSIATLCSYDSFVLQMRKLT